MIFSPVADPAGPGGLCIVQVPDLAAAQALTDGDPAVRGGVGHYEILELFSPVLADDLARNPGAQSTTVTAMDSRPAQRAGADGNAPVL